MIDYKAIIDYYYDGNGNENGNENAKAKEILLIHSRQVAEKAVSIVDAHPEWKLDRDFVYAAAMLHDIGIIRCDAPGIHCHGTEPYIRHGVIGATLLTSLKGRNLTAANPKSPFKADLEGLSRVCARHTGTGLPGLEPETLEEQIICYADKFFSKTKLDKEKTFDEACRSLMKFGEKGVRKFEAWHKKFQ
jgi:uncharacterized protein